MGRKASRITPLYVLAALLLSLAAVPAQAQWQLQSPNGNSSIKFGFLAQMRAESLDTGADTAQNLFFRRLRLLAGGKLTDKVSFFMETDSPNLGKAGAGGTKNAGDIYIQDFVVTYKPGSDAFNLDTGMLLIETSHNSNQSAVSLMTVDYGPYSFVSSGPIDARVGRDYGVRARGYLANDHFEYRAGIYQGKRGAASDNSFRFAGRAVFYAWGAEKGLFYRGTSLGKSKTLAFGVSADHQEDYDAYAGDIFWDQPLSGGNGFTFQADWIQYDGDVFLTNLPKQDDALVEVGFYSAATKLLPFVQYAKRNFDNPATGDEDQLQVGLGYMFRGHNGNLKLSYGRLSKDGTADRDLYWLNYQVFAF